MPTPRPPVGGSEEVRADGSVSRNTKAVSGWSFFQEHIMANVQVIQRNAHLAGSVKLEFVNGREAKVAKATLTAISNTRRGSGEDR